MNWEDAIPSIAIAPAARVTEPAMDSDQFAAFYERSARSPCGPTWRAHPATARSLTT